MAKDVCIKAGSFCPVCRGLKGADCWHDASEFHSGSLYLNRVLELKDENEALREALQKAHDALSPAVGEVEITGMLAPPIYRAFGILLDALKETSDGL